jgi:hypothetical protein
MSHLFKKMISHQIFSCSDVDFKSFIKSVSSENSRFLPKKDHFRQELSFYSPYHMLSLQQIELNLFWKGSPADCYLSNFFTWGWKRP